MEADGRRPARALSAEATVAMPLGTAANSFGSMAGLTSTSLPSIRAIRVDTSSKA